MRDFGVIDRYIFLQVGWRRRFTRAVIALRALRRDHGRALLEIGVVLSLAALITWLSVR